MKRKGGIRVDPAVVAFQQRAATNTAALTSKQRADRRRRALQVKLDLASPTRKSLLEWIAEREKTSMSQAGNLLLAWAMREYLRGEAKICEAFEEGKSPARTPRFEWNVCEPENWARLLDNFRGNGDVDGGVQRGRREKGTKSLRPRKAGTLAGTFDAAGEPWRDFIQGDGQRVGENLRGVARRREA